MKDAAAKTTKKYLKALENSDYVAMMSIFSKHAIVNSPLLGRIKAAEFYKTLFTKTSKSKITLLDMFRSINAPNLIIAYFQYVWMLKNGVRDSFKCVDVFKFDKAGKISELTIIYDTARIRDSYEKLKR